MVFVWQGCVPATVGVVRGRITVGLSSDEIKCLGESAKKCNASGSPTLFNNPLVKVSRRDIPFAISHVMQTNNRRKNLTQVEFQIGLMLSLYFLQKLSGGTTVSGTIIAAVKAGIPVFATGRLFYQFTFFFAKRSSYLLLLFLEYYFYFSISLPNSLFKLRKKDFEIFFSFC